MRAARGFTLIEMMLAMVLAGVITTAATSATIAIVRTITGLQQAAAADSEAKLVLDHLTTEALQTGGGSVRPWQTISNDCGSGTSMPACTSPTNRLHIIEADADLPTCTIAGWDGASNVADVLAPGGVCCLDAFGGTPHDVVLTTTVTGGGWAVRRCTPVGSSCQCNFTNITGATDLAPASGITVNAADWVGGDVAPVAEALSFYVDPTTHTLFERVVANNADTASTLVVSDRVYDLQVQFGYDDAPADGHLDTTWLDTVDPAKAPNLRMVRIGIVVGVDAPARDTGSAAELFHSGKTFQSTGGKLFRAANAAVALRNVLIFY